ncbi:segregation and condensation protein A [Vagococcus vulneris]|uniref:Segregation and condensation protein A n=1 Tax=Vagococcus vulneris TaxID=1977869 RepID=A0A430A215_9ENTE|nr:segregation/condensation protein A [Vagococcus vulneris]RSU00465.1 segregation/condensation protein A [Vagococcus vulneris]
MEELKIKLDVFEGPLDLLLHLIKTLEIDIYDIPIAQITDQYMSYIHSMKVLDLEIAGDYIVMAATLMSIKSKMLIPQVAESIAEESDYHEEEDPREQLVNQLLEYRKYKYAASVLRDREVEREQFFTREPADLAEVAIGFKPLDEHELTIIDLFLAAHDIIQRKSEETSFGEANIYMESYTIEDKLLEISEKIVNLSKGEGLNFSVLIKASNRTEIVTTFMAILELIKSGQVLVEQNTINAPIILFNKHSDV